MNKKNNYLATFYSAKRRERVIKCSCGQSIKIGTDKEGNIISSTFIMKPKWWRKLLRLE